MIVGREVFIEEFDNSAVTLQENELVNVYFRSLFISRGPKIGWPAHLTMISSVDASSVDSQCKNAK